jgi:magnesium-transporting ATPase (P-type)
MLILIQNDLQLVSMTGNIDNYYIRDSEEFFNRQCNRLNRSICDYGFMISIYTFIVLVYLIAYTSININLCNSIEDKNIEDKKSLSKNINITILSISVISLLLLIATYFSPYGKVVTKFANIGNDIANNIL